MSVSSTARLRGHLHRRTASRRSAASPLAVTVTLALLLTLGALAAPSLDEWRPLAPPRQCDRVRQQLQEHANIYFLKHRHWPDRQLSELSGEDYLGSPVTSCPTSGARYELAGPFVACPLHESERER